MLGVVKDVSSFPALFYRPSLTLNGQTQYMTADNINIGIGAIAECIEMT